MDDKNNLFNDDIEIIDDFDNDDFGNTITSDEINLSNNQSLPENDISGPDFMSDFIYGVNNEIDYHQKILIIPQL